ncbi:MAG: type II secretion system protein GspM [Janthinobacterium lividum]
MKAILIAWWAERNVREKRLLALGAAILALLLFYQVLVAPARDGSAAIRAALPTMKQQLVTMEGQANESKRLAGVAHTVAPSGDSLVNGVSASLTDRGLTPTKVELAGNAVQVEMKNVSFARWIGWLDDVRKQLKVKVSQTHVTPSGNSGRVDIRATLDAGPLEPQAR